MISHESTMYGEGGALIVCKWKPNFAICINVIELQLGGGGGVVLLSSTSNKNEN